MKAVCTFLVLTSFAQKIPICVRDGCARLLKNFDFSIVKFIF